MECMRYCTEKNVTQVLYHCLHSIGKEKGCDRGKEVVTERGREGWREGGCDREREGGRGGGRDIGGGVQMNSRKGC